MKRGSKKKEIGRTAQIEGYMARAGVKELFAAALEAVLATSRRKSQYSCISRSARAKLCRLAL